jgi:hypothetical protein
MAYLLQCLIALDQMANALLAGHADETLSARAWRTEQRGARFGRIWRPVIDALALAVTLGRDRDHCRRSYESEVMRRQLPSEYQIF